MKRAVDSRRCAARGVHAIRAGRPQHRRVSAARHLRHLPRGAAQGRGRHSLHAVAARAGGFVRGGAHRHRQLQREGHHREDHLRRAPERGECAEAGVRAEGEGLHRPRECRAVHRHHRRPAAGGGVPQREGHGSQDHPHLLGPRAGPRQGLHARHRGAVRGLRRGGAERRQAAPGQLRPAEIPGATRRSGRAGWRRRADTGAW